MRKAILTFASGTLLLAAPALAQDRGDMMRGGMMGHHHGDMMGGGMRGHSGMGMMGRLSPEDMEAFTDARIAALHAGLKLSAEQERMWPPVEQAIRGLVRTRRDQARMWRENPDRARDDLPSMLRSMADRQSARADALRRLADAAAPLYASLDDGQKRRLLLLIRHMRPHGGMMRHGWRGMDQGGPPMNR